MTSLSDEEVMMLGDVITEDEATNVPDKVDGFRSVLQSAAKNCSPPMLLLLLFFNGYEQRLNQEYSSIFLA